MESEIEIVLPKKIYILEGCDNEEEQLNIYFENIMMYCPENAYVDIVCDYGRHNKNFWRLDIHEIKSGSGGPTYEPFPLTILIQKFDGTIIASKSTQIQVVPKLPNKECTILCIGDSMTRAGVYVQHIQQKLLNVRMMGSRTYDRILYHEGRGGWSVFGHLGYLSSDKSPFMFPAGIDGEKYLGNCDFWKKVLYDETDGYDYKGFQKIASYENGEPRYDQKGFPVQSCEEDVVYDPLYHGEGSFMYMKNGAWESLDKTPKWEFNFQKYIKRFKRVFDQNNGTQPDIVSILLGANDFQHVSYDKFHEALEGYLNGLQIMIDSIKEYNPDIFVIINMPVIGAHQDAWGICQGCLIDAMKYKHHILKANRAILEKWDNDEILSTGVYISPMLINLDINYGFDKQVESANKYSSISVERANNWVHPNICGYKQMGDVLAAVIQKITT